MKNASGAADVYSQLAILGVSGGQALFEVLIGGEIGYPSTVPAYSSLAEWATDKKKQKLMEQYKRVANSALAFVIDPENLGDYYRKNRNNYMEGLAKYIERRINSDLPEQVKKIELDYLLNVVQLNVLSPMRNALAEKV